MKRLLLFIPIFLTLYSCTMKPGTETMKKWKQEVLDTEQKFAQMVAKEGLHAAFLAFAAEDAVLMRNNKLVIGLAEIDQLYKGNDATGLEWTPDFVDVANSGDMAYTYGNYTFKSLDPAGNGAINSGVFHTVWKRQDDGEWKFVWD